MNVKHGSLRREQFAELGKKYQLVLTEVISNDQVGFCNGTSTPKNLAVYQQVDLLSSPSFRDFLIVMKLNDTLLIPSDKVLRGFFFVDNEVTLLIHR